CVPRPLTPSLMFGRHSLADVHVPVLMYGGDGDKLVFPDKNVAALARKLPVAPQFRMIAGAGHFVFMAPCNEEQLKATPALCTDPEGVNRVDIHRDLIFEAARFFSEVLSVPNRGGLQTADQ
ncbi:dienelactone hydrolase, partial [Pseudomonas agarici]|nr:dienelactone hydrolase [Pseudomonas agarici]